MNTVQIIGGGLAGLSLGIALRKEGVPVLVREAGHYPRHRVCGEFICGVNEEALQTLGISDLFEGATQLHSTTWYQGNKEALSRPLPFPATGLSRHALDLRLTERLTELGGELSTGDRHRMNGDHPEGEVRATGRITGNGDLMGLKMHLKGYEFRADLEMHFGPGGYCGISAVENGRANLCGLFHKRPEIKASREELMVSYLEACGLTDLAERVRASEIDHASHSAVASVPVGYCRKALPGEPCSVGDHFGMMGPFTGNGMSMAFESAMVSTDALATWGKGQASWEKTTQRVLQAQRRRFHRRLSISHSMHGFLLSKWGLQSISLMARSGLLPFRQLFHATR